MPGWMTASSHAKLRRLSLSDAVNWITTETLTVRYLDGYKSGGELE